MIKVLAEKCSDPIGVMAPDRGQSTIREQRKEITESNLGEHALRDGFNTRHNKELEI